MLATLRAQILINGTFRIDVAARHLSPTHNAPSLISNLDTHAFCLYLRFLNNTGVTYTRIYGSLFE